ncbi:antitoxin [Rhizorhabdus dicambivorans]|uniref:Antitoxin n=1 Tax=Rhizorhabdus dicambivorans TaxID=1850238 RepID=A0A2A4FWN0_9SPHN|nr:antitoxin [Rhizorhabdus dicambivorans]ATE64113.1 antitoxin [Rhizorhabdus dicambivorans]PCE42613.1 antitoxin [Rhizorhabdus dicambivorans]
MSRLTIDISDKQHQNLKALAALQGKTIRQYAIERLFPADADGDHAWQELKDLLAQRIADGLDGATSAKSIEAIVDEELGQESRA